LFNQIISGVIPHHTTPLKASGESSVAKIEEEEWFILYCSQRLD